MGNEPLIVGTFLDQVRTGYPVELMATSRDRCVFTTAELERFEFDVQELVASQTNEK